MNYVAKNVDIKKSLIKDNFFSPYQDLVRNVVIPYQHDILEDKVPGAEKSHAIDNFRIAAGDVHDTFYGWVFQDSDVAKWIEACAYSLAIHRDEALEKTVNDCISLIGRAQQPDGYLNTYFTVKEPEHRWENLRECHELYCEGHMIEAAVAYYEATGNDNLLKIMMRMADYTYDTFIGSRDPKRAGSIPGHPEIELALMRLYHLTNNTKYLELTKFFIDNRGQSPSFFEEETKRRNWSHWGNCPEDKEYSQNHLPVREQTTAVGHAVRAVYLYTGMADMAATTGDSKLFKACDTLFDDIAYKQSYITGGIGSTNIGEAFTRDYDLPNDTVYNETCAAIGLIFFSNKMLNIKPDSKYSDLIERTLYNGVLSGMQLDGKSFFYVNPLEVNPDLSGKLADYRHVLPVRPKWFGCACCPPNVARLLTSLGSYIMSYNNDTIYAHLFIGGNTTMCLGDNESTDILSITTDTDYPRQGDITYNFDKVPDKVITYAIRIPGYCIDRNTNHITASLTYNNNNIDISSVIKDGYAYITQKFMKGDTVKLSVDMNPKRVYANVNVRQDECAVAITRGPITYCFEGVDNSSAPLQTYRIASDGAIHELPYNKNLLNGIIPLEIEGYIASSSKELYSYNRPTFKVATLRAIPYYSWGNRGENQMRVWMYEK